jgi:hypothetical protein
VGVSFLRDVVWQIRYATRVQGSRSPGKTGYCEIKAAPEQVHRTDFAPKTRPEFLEHVINCDKRAVKARYCVCIVRTRGGILGKWYRFLQFVRAAVDLRIAAELLNHPGKLAVEIGDRHWLESKAPGCPSGTMPVHPVINEIEYNLDASVAVWHQRRRQPTRRDVRGRMPGMINPWATDQAVLAHNLQVKVQGSRRGLPFGERNVWPVVYVGIVFSHELQL